MTFVLPALVLCVSCSLAGAATIFGPVPYRQRSDSPFYAGVQTGDIYLEDFEDRILNTPGASSVGRVGESQGVDEDDGGLDGLGRNMVWISNNGSGPSVISFTPDPGRGLPTYVGVALLGGTSISPQFSVGQYFHAFDGAGSALLGDGLFIEAVRLPPNASFFSSGGDQFIGVYFETGIGRIELSGYTFDHLQYGWAIPEPGTVTLSGLAAGLLLRRRRRHR